MTNLNFSDLANTYHYFNVDQTIPEIIEFYHNIDLKSPRWALGVSKLQATEALIDWLSDNCFAWYGVDLSDHVDNMIGNEDDMPEVLEMKSALEALESIDEDLINKGFVRTSLIGA